MGIDVHALNFLRYVNRKGNFGETITIARQGFHVIEPYVRDKYIHDMIRTLTLKNDVKYCEGLLLSYFGSSKVDSIDNSDYEQASIVHDMNLPLPSELHGLYDTILDAGTTEHIYNVTQSLKNCSSLCKPGGQIIHVLPANNFCGHGFWQFSPELFFSLYSEENGYGETEVFLADVTNIKKWYKVKKPRNGQRVTVHSSNRLHAMVRTVLKLEDFAHKNVQQSDYISRWSGEPRGGVGDDESSVIIKTLKGIKRSKLTKSLITPIYNSYYRLRPAPTMKLNSLNPGLKKFDVASLLKK